MKKLFIFTVFFFCFFSISFSQTANLRGIVIDKKTKNPIPSANVVLKVGYEEVMATSADLEGKFEMIDLWAGSYRLVVSLVGYQQYILDTLILKSDSIKFFEVRMNKSGVTFEEYEIVDYKVPMIDKDRTENDVTVTSEEIARMPNRNANAVTTKVNGVLDNSQADISSIQAGLNISEYRNQITASEINDFSKYDAWENIKKTRFIGYLNYWDFNLKDRYVVEVIYDDYAPAIGLDVRLLSKKGDILWEAKTDNTGKSELWAVNTMDEKGIRVEIIKNDGSLESIKPKPFSEAINKVKIEGSCQAPQVIDIAFMVDATGSMDDEIDFLKSDLVDIIQSTSETFPNTEINMGSIFYRCEGNDYVSRISDLTNDIQKSVEFIQEQDAAQGGDEVVHIALMKAVRELSWNIDRNSIKILFLVLDQQPSPSEKTLQSLNSSIRLASKLGIRIVPIVASAETMSTSISLEYLMRTISLATNGTNLFLTDHSNIGRKHATPTTDTYEVEYLNEALKRIIYQYTYVVDCEKDIDDESVSDTTYIFPKRIIAHEVVDSTLTVEEKERSIQFIDLSDGEGFSSLDQSLDINNFTNTDEFPIGVKFYPNPTKGPLNIELRGAVKEIYLFDIGGKMLQKNDVSGQSLIKLNLNTWSRGIYFLKYQINGKWFSGKIILSY